jgi:hypothetical protein
MAHRLMKDRTFRQSQLDDVYAPHVEPINRLVDRLRDPAGRGWMPYVAPMYGGVNAQVLLLLRDPGPKTNSGTGFDGSGGDVRTSPSGADVVAEKGADTLIAEVKGATASAGLDVDTMYGQLLRRMTAGASSTRFAVVVPRSAAGASPPIPPSALARIVGVSPRTRQAWAYRRLGPG